MNNSIESSKINRNKIVLAQTNPHLGNIEYNAIKTLTSIKKAEKLGADIIIFPELTLIGAPVYDIQQHYPNLTKENYNWLNQIAQQTKNIIAIVGYLTNDGKSNVAIIKNGKILKTLDINPNDTNNIFELNGITYCIYINNSIEKINKSLENIDFIINITAEPSRKNTAIKRRNLLSNIAQKYNKPIIFVNQTGAIDDLSYDGGSCIFDNLGNLIAQAKMFEEDFFIYSQNKNNTPIIIDTLKIKDDFQKQNTENFNIDYESDLERTYLSIKQAIKDYFEKNNLKKAILGLSGGLDSSVSAVLLADAIGAKNVLGVSMPSNITSETSKNDAKELARNLNINFVEIPIKDMFYATNNTFLNLFNNISNFWAETTSTSFVNDNIQARSRATILWGISNNYPASIPIATSDKSELYMGYATINGDMSGGFAPLADVVKTKLFALAHWLNKNREQKNAIPISIITKPPGAELAINPKTGKPLEAEEALMPYIFLDEIIWRIETKQQSYEEMLDSTFLYEKNNNIAKEQKIEWLNKFYKRKSSALFKWTLLPPSVIIEEKSINKKDYLQPAIANKIPYRAQSIEKIRQILQTIDN